MLVLKVPYAEKDQAKALGARWNNDRKVWYVPDGQPSAPFEKWLTSPQETSPAGNGSSPKASKPKVDSYSGVPGVGEHYFKLEHDCNPFVECQECLPLLESSGWKAEHDSAVESLAIVHSRNS